MLKKIAMAYVPVIHRGYAEFFHRHGRQEGGDQVECFVFGQEIIKLIDRQLDYLRKEIRAISPEEASRALTALDVAYEVRVLDLEDCQKIAQAGLEIILPAEDASQVLVEQYFNANPVTYDNVFLRWNRDNVNAEKSIVPDQVISITDFDRGIMRQANEVAKRSSDWWRQIGAVATRANGQVLFSCYNRHLPSPRTPYFDGDSRNTTHRGEGLDLYTSIHAEAAIVASAAKEGMSLADTYLYVSTFPCPPCAKLIALSGFSRLYYGDGYAVLDGEDVLRCHDVEIIKVDLPLAPNG